jgi:MarR family transcriptional repressor of mepA
MSKNDRLIYLISTAQHLLKNHLKDRFKQEGIKITPTHSAILFLLMEKGPMLMNDLSRELYIENSTVTGLVDRLEERGFVSRLPVSNDRRKWNISITHEGINEIKKTQGIIKSVNSMIGEGFTKEDIKSLQKILNSFFEKFI